MDTKLKKYKYSVWFKLLAIVLCVAGMLALAYGLLQAPYFRDAIQNKEFSKSAVVRSIWQQAYSDISLLAFKYKNEDYIKSGAALEQDEINERKNSLDIERSDELQQVENDFYSSFNQYQNYMDDNNSSVTGDADIISDIKNKDIKEKIEQLKSKKDSDTKVINQKYDKLISDVKQQAIYDQLSDYKAKLDDLKAQEGLHYTVLEKGKSAFSNVNGFVGSDIERFFKALPYYEVLTDSNSHQYFSNYNYMAFRVPADTKVFIGMSQERFKTEVTAFENNSGKGLTGIKTAGLGLLAFISGLIYLMYSAGRRPHLEGVHLIAADIIYLDVALAVTVSALALCIAPIVSFLQEYYSDKLRFNTTVVFVIFAIVIAIGTLIGILFVTMFSKRLKRHEVIRHTLLYRLYKWVFNKLRIFYSSLKNMLFDKSPLKFRLVLVFGTYALLMLIFSMIFVSHDSVMFIGFLGIAGTNIIAFYYLLKALKIFADIRNGAERIRAGELSYNIPEQGIPELKSLAGTINQIADGLKNAVSSQVKAERMKAELITNVSHDLKTPLTSIITYVDLLKSEGLQSENADKYVCIIDSKSQRLKSLTEDLFEAAKATSGTIAVNYERLNAASLITQGLGELSDKIEASGLTFRTSFPSENVYVSADGRLLWRVVENLLSNVFKYALTGSRVYIDVAAVNEKVRINVKNISAYELNVNEDELMERFIRGDASRHSEGSGLGLSIAKSLTELQGGSFSISIDGDLFKATVELPRIR